MEVTKREPTQITQGDTISFTKTLSQYPATDGWSLLYSLRGNGQDLQFTSTASGSDHEILVDAAETELWLPSDYQMEGWAVNGDQRFQIYLSSLVITPDLATAAPDVDVRTHAQKMLALVEQQLEQCAKNILITTTVEGTAIERERRNELLRFRQSYIQERRGQLATEDAKAGRPNRRKIKTFLNVMQPFAGNGAAFGSSIFNLELP